jgi:hypothetical protein
LAADKRSLIAMDKDMSSVREISNTDCFCEFSPCFCEFSPAIKGTSETGLLDTLTPQENLPLFVAPSTQPHGLFTTTPRELVEACKATIDVTQKELAYMLGLSESSLGRMKRSVTVLPLRVRLSLEAIMKANADDPILRDDLVDAASPQVDLDLEDELHCPEVDLEAPSLLADNNEDDLSPNPTSMRNLIMSFLRETDVNGRTVSARTVFVMQSCDALIRMGLWKDTLDLEASKLDKLRWDGLIRPYLSELMTSRAWIDACVTDFTLRARLLSVAPEISLCRAMSNLVCNGFFGQIGADREVMEMAFARAHRDMFTLFLDVITVRENVLLSSSDGAFASGALPVGCLLSSGAETLTRNATDVLGAEGKRKAPAFS